jgi:hypothetical protein
MADESLPERDTPAYTRPRAREDWLTRRRRKIQEEIERNRRGDYKIPTWVLTVLLLVIVTAWILLIVLS